MLQALILGPLLLQGASPAPTPTTSAGPTERVLPLGGKRVPPGRPDSGFEEDPERLDRTVSQLVQALALAAVGFMATRRLGGGNQNVD